MSDLSTPLVTWPMQTKTLRIGALARLTKTNPTIIRQYEDFGLLALPERPGQSRHSDLGGERVYDDADVRRLIFLRRCRDLGVLNPRLKLLVELIDNVADASPDARELASNLLDNVRDQVKELTELAATLEALVAGDGSEALAATDIDTTPIDGMKRMRRQLRKPLKTPAGS